MTDRASAAAPAATAVVVPDPRDAGGGARTVRLRSGPNSYEKSCSGHSPPLSQTGQSSGWLRSMNSSTASCASLACSEVPAVRTTMPSPHDSVQAACSFGAPSISTRHMRQAPIGGPRRGS